MTRNQFIFFIDQYGIGETEFRDGPRQLLDLRRTMRARIGPEKLFDWMRAHKMITKFNEPYADFCKRGYLRPRSSSFTRSDGTTQTTMSTRVTPKGIYYIRERLIKEGLLKPEHQINIDYLQQEIELS